MIKFLFALALLGIVAGPRNAAAAPAGTTGYGDIAICRQVATLDNDVIRTQCKFMNVNAHKALTIEYVSGQCITTPHGSFIAKQFQLVTAPNGNPAVPVPYQVPVNRTVGFVNGSVSFGAASVSINAGAGTPLYAYVDLVFPQRDPMSRNIVECSVSVSGYYPGL